MCFREFWVDLNGILKLDVGLAILAFVEVGDAFVEKFLLLDLGIKRTRSNNEHHDEQGDQKRRSTIASHYKDSPDLTEPRPQSSSRMQAI